jgi:hypothetical protein
MLLQNVRILSPVTVVNPVTRRQKAVAVSQKLTPLKTFHRDLWVERRHIFRERDHSVML